MPILFGLTSLVGLSALGLWLVFGGPSDEPPEERKAPPLSGFFLAEDPSSARGSNLGATATPPTAPARAVVRTHSDPSSLRSFTVSPAVRIDSGGSSAAAEVSMAASGDDIVAAWIDLRSGEDRVRVGAAVSHDFGLTWNDQLLQPTGNPDSDDLHGDPMTAYDRRTGQLWVGGLAFFDQSLFVARQVIGTDSFTAPVTLGRSLVVDKPWLAAGSPPGAPGTTRLYAIDATGELFFSDDLGVSWSGGGSTQIALGHLPRVGPEGELYVAYRAGQNSDCFVQRSGDGGLSFGPPRLIGPFSPFSPEVFIPGEFRAPSFCVLAVDPVDGTLFTAAAAITGSSGGNTDIGVFLTRSDDEGETWTAPQIVSGGTSPSDQFLPWLEIDTSGRLHLTFLDSRRVMQDDDASAALLDVYYSVSNDRGQTWTEVPLTPQPFDSTFSPWFNDIPQFVGDYLGLAVGEDRAIVGYAATYNGDLDIYAQRILFSESQVFGDGFESGNTQGWSGQSP